ncbi:MAG: SAF domain-containing protein [Propionibacteriaceae bacterium]
MVSSTPPPEPQLARTRVQARARRNSRQIAVGVAAICLGGLGSAGLWVQAASSSQVVQLAHDLHRGEVVDADDFVAVTIGRVPQGATVPANQIATLVGRTALADLPTGSLLAPGAVGETSLTKDQIVVGLRLEAGRVPAQTLYSGTNVVLVGVAPAGQPADKAESKTIAAIVSTASALQPDGEITLDVVVSRNDAVQTTKLAAANQLAVVKESSR